MHCCFKPAGIAHSGLKEIILTLDELEAMRLADLGGMYQEHAAKEMNVSRQTFGNILTSAHKKTADVLLNGHVLKIEGGNVVTQKQNRCGKCHHEWQRTENEKECPACHR
jgi:predicted DNA-binding protein (UPF0251 family)